jgi:hypothetical protein
MCPNESVQIMRVRKRKKKRPERQVCGKNGRKRLKVKRSQREWRSD